MTPPRTRKRTDADRIAPARDDMRRRLERERDEAAAMLREMGVTVESEPAGPRAAAEAVLDVGDAAQASERRDLGATTRERLANRINRLTAALERIDEGTYGQCSICGEEIGAARLAAIPEAGTCLPCQEQRERADGR